jgi:hypothetical protein
MRVANDVTLWLSIAAGLLLLAEGSLTTSRRDAVE